MGRRIKEWLMEDTDHKAKCEPENGGCGKWFKYKPVGIFKKNVPNLCGRCSKVGR